MNLQSLMAIPSARAVEEAACGRERSELQLGGRAGMGDGEWKGFYDDSHLYAKDVPWGGGQRKKKDNAQRKSMNTITT
jgi:hypothetical protein